MDFNSIIDLISQVGFPIAMCIAMAWYVYSQQKNHKAEMDKMSEAINNNTIVMEKILTKIGAE